MSSPAGTATHSSPASATPTAPAPWPVRRIRTNGHVIDVSSDPLPNGGWTMAATDISPLAGAEDEARRRAAILNSILDAIPHGVCVYSADRRVTMFNRAYTQAMTGAPLNIGDHLETVIRRRAEAGEYGPGDPDKIFAQQMAFDVSRAQSRKRRRPNGMTVDVRTTPLPNGGYISVVTDITPLTEAEAEVSRRAEELAVMLSCIRHGVMLWGSDHRLLASNAIAAELLRHPPGLLEPGRTQDEILENLRGARAFRRRRRRAGTCGHARQSGPVRTLSAADRHPGRACARCPLRPDARRRLGHHVHRRDRGADRRGPSCAAPRRRRRRPTRPSRAFSPR